MPTVGATTGRNLQLPQPTARAREPPACGNGPALPRPEGQEKCDQRTARAGQRQASVAHTPDAPDLCGGESEPFRADEGAEDGRPYSRMRTQAHPFRSSRWTDGTQPANAGQEIIRGLQRPPGTRAGGADRHSDSRSARRCASAGQGSGLEW